MRHSVEAFNKAAYQLMTGTFQPLFGYIQQNCKRLLADVMLWMARAPMDGHMQCDRLPVSVFMHKDVRSKWLSMCVQDVADACKSGAASSLDWHDQIPESVCRMLLCLAILVLSLTLSSYCYAQISVSLRRMWLMLARLVLPQTSSLGWLWATSLPSSPAWSSLFASSSASP